MNKLNFLLYIPNTVHVFFLHQVKTTLNSQQVTEDYEELINVKSKDESNEIDYKKYVVLGLQFFVRWLQHPIAAQDMHCLFSQWFLWRPNVIEEHTQQVLLHILQNLVLP